MSISYPQPPDSRLFDQILVKLWSARLTGAPVEYVGSGLWLEDAYYNLANSRLTVSVAVTRAALSGDDEVGRDDAATLGSSRWTVRREDGGDHEPRRADAAEGADSGSRG